METLPRIQVAAGILWSRQLLLATKRPEGGAFAGYWEFPGGKCEQNETPLDTLKRELREELGVTVTHAELFAHFTHTYRERGYLVELYFYDVQTFLGEPKGLEGQELCWFTPLEAQTIPFLPADTVLLPELISLQQKHADV